MLPGQMVFMELPQTWACKSAHHCIIARPVKNLITHSSTSIAHPLQAFLPPHHLSLIPKFHRIQPLAQHHSVEGAIDLHQQLLNLSAEGGFLPRKQNSSEPHMLHNSEQKYIKTLSQCITFLVLMNTQKHSKQNEMQHGSFLPNSGVSEKLTT